jgi:hypothetical protein
MEGSSVRTRAATAFRALLPSLRVDAEDLLGRPDTVAFVARLETSLLDIVEPLEIVYGSAALEPLVRAALAAAPGARPPSASWTGDERSTLIGISGPGRSGTSPTPTGSPGRFARSPTNWTIWTSSA